MITYQDLQLSTSREHFILTAINDYKSSTQYKISEEAENYSRQRNTTILRYQKLLRTASGKLIPNRYSSNHKMCSNFFKRFITQENQYLLGNGAMFSEDLSSQIGRDFDNKLQRAGYEALKAGVSYIFFNLDHIEVFPALQFCPLFDEEDGALKAGVRFWQISPEKPLRATLYELDGYTDYIYNSRDKSKDPVFEVLHDKTPYKLRLYTTPATNSVIYEGMNYNNFPIIPLWGNEDKQSELVGLREEIDAYDLIRSGFANDLDDCSQIYWLVENSGGMEEEDLAEFLSKLARNHIAEVGTQQDSKVTPYEVEVPYQSRETYLTRLEADMYNDAMALNVNQISAGNITATAIQASYEPLNNKTDSFEYCVRVAINELLKLINKTEVTFYFRRSMLANQTEVTQMVMSASNYLDRETILKKLPFVENDEIENILLNLDKEEAGRFVEAPLENTVEEPTES